LAVVNPVILPVILPVTIRLPLTVVGPKDAWPPTDGIAIVPEDVNA